MENTFKAMLSIGGATLSYLLGGWSALLQVLLVFVIIDYLTGIMAAYVDGKLSSKTGFKGIAKKVSIFLMIAVAHLIDVSLGTEIFFRDATIFFYVGNEVISILENSGRIGIPIPPGLEKAIEIFKEKADTKKEVK